VRQAITASFRAVPELLAFVNALSRGLANGHAIPERFTYDERDRFAVPAVADGARRDGEPVLGVIAESSIDACAQSVASEVERLLSGGLVRDRHGPPRLARPEDIAILFRARAGHQYFEDALEARGVRTYVYKGLGFFDAPEVQDLQALLRCLAQPDSDLRAAEFLRSRFVRLSDVALTRLAPAFADALAGPDVDPARLDLPELDRRLLIRARVGLDRWRELADRVPPGELVDLVLRESAYAAELGGRRLAQARENVKKVRALVRRVESRGYATLDRLARYFETLRAGDESNAIVEAAGAVNLMTIHAAKGLEFPIVFLVNLQMPGRGRQAGFTVIESGPNGTPEVAFSTTAATELEDQREEEELRRLFYVAVTRARDRLYLSAQVDDQGRVRRRAGRSLAGLLPAGLADVFRAAATGGGDEVRWTAEEGAFDLRVCRPAQPTSASNSSLATDQPAQAAPASIPRPIVAPGRSPASVTEWPGSAEPGRAHHGPAEHGSSSSDRLTGTVVHRLFARGLSAGIAHSAVVALVPGLVRADELVDAPPLAELANRAAQMFLTLLSRPDVASLLAGGQCFHEVPFSFAPPDRPDVLFRGAVDCLVVGADAEATILEFKTGQPRPEHEIQASAYTLALTAALPNLKISAKIVYL
jgi:ATP-dependent exoDNAse (exonuclease V) beta subunit